MNLELEKKKLELKKVETSKAEFEYKILERLQDIERLKDNVANQDKAAHKIREEIKQMEDS